MCRDIEKKNSIHIDFYFCKNVNIFTFLNIELLFYS